jgi:hypothetical protein
MGRIVIGYDMKLDRNMIGYGHDKHLLYHVFDNHMITCMISLFYYIP